MRATRRTLTKWFSNGNFIPISCQVKEIGLLFSRSVVAHLCIESKGHANNATLQRINVSPVVPQSSKNSPHSDLLSQSTLYWLFKHVGFFSEANLNIRGISCSKQAHVSTLKFVMGEG